MAFTYIKKLKQSHKIFKSHLVTILLFLKKINIFLSPYLTIIHLARESHSDIIFQIIQPCLTLQLYSVSLHDEKLRIYCNIHVTLPHEIESISNCDFQLF